MDYVRKIKFNTLCLSILILIFITNTYLYSINYYVKTNGNNIGNNGLSWNQAWETISHAASNVGAGNTVFVSNGIYNERVVVQSNGAPGNYITFQAVNPNQAIINGAGKNTCFYLNTKSYIWIQGFLIKNASSTGIYIDNANNYIVKNTIYSNTWYGITIDGGNNNYINGNIIFGTNQNYGIQLNNGTNNIISSNQIYHCDYRAISLNTSSISNYVIRNTLYSNVNDAIYIEGDYNFICTNDIIKNQHYGMMVNGNNNIIESNQIGKNASIGILFLKDLFSNKIINNRIYSNYIGAYMASNNKFYHFTHNEIYNSIKDGISMDYSASNYFRQNKIYSNITNGISFWRCNHNSIFSNSIFGPFQNVGIRMQEVTNNIIYRNVLYNNQQNSIELHYNSIDIRIINNTIFGSIVSNGIHWTDNASGVMYNNIILSNGNGDDPGLYSDSTGNVYASYNLVYGHQSGQISGNITLGSGNITNQNPLIDTTSTFVILSSNSPAIDSGTNYWGFGYNRNGWDMGWKEALFSTSGPTSPSTNTNILTTYLEERRFKNNIIKFCQGQTVTYQHLFKEAGDLEALIVDITGDVVKKFPKVSGLKGNVKTIEWDGKDEKGNCCAPGYYILYIKPDNKKYKIIIY